jgi:hypothetical protein
VTPTIPKDYTVQQLCVQAINWIKTWFWKVELESEFISSKDLFFKWIENLRANDMLPTSTFQAIRDLVIEQLLPTVSKWARQYRFLKEGVMENITTSIVESQNATIKGNKSFCVKPQMNLDKTVETLTSFGRNYIDRKLQKSATQYKKNLLP